MSSKFAFTVAACLAAAATPQTVLAQPVDQLGNRAGAIGAFVAVADDASAVAWNPAGLVNGPIFNILLDFGQTTTGPGDQVTEASRERGRTASSFISVASLPIGISYFRARQTELSPAAQPVLGRQDRQVSVRSLLLSHLGVTVLHSIVAGVTVGATAKVVRGSFASGETAVRSWDEGFTYAGNLESEGRTTADVDVGVLAGGGRARIGLVARNLAAPAFEAGGDAMTVARQVRVGAAWGDRWPSPPRLILALDADLTRVAHAGGERRDVAAGVERWFRGQTIALRGGVRASTIGERRPVASLGASYAVRNGVYVDVHAATGREADRRWGIAGRLSY
jgi:hypothetical protein